ncbi:DUF4331 domain-containing protein [Sphingomonas sp. RB1R13]|uniref:DUF4331 domain-containing protein n=1 Tax=Sphingomonas sp. RB1R13 TaxID=3096159 RepID=UPI002FC5EB1F
MMMASTAIASSHREAPGITKMPKVDNTDVYAFQSYETGRAGYTTLIANFQPGENPGDGPNYYTMDPDAIYEIHVDNAGDAKEHLTFQFKFTNSLKNDTGKTVTVGGKVLPIALRHIGPISAPLDANLGEDEQYTLTLVTGDRRTGTKAAVTNASGGGSTFVKPFDNAGNKSVPNYPAYANQFIYNVAIPGCSGQGRVFAGQRQEAFAVNLGPVMDLVNFVPIEGSIVQSDANQELIGKKNVTTLAIEVPTTCLVGTSTAANGVIGVWSTASLPQAKLHKPNPTYKNPTLSGGAYTQVSRLGMPLVNEVVIGLPQKDLFNAAKPTQDGALADYVTNPTFPAILEVLFGSAGIKAPTNFPRNDLVATFLTGIKTLNQLPAVTASEMIRLNTKVTPTPAASQNSLGVAGNDLAGFPNGRRPGDDVVDVVLRVAMGRLCYPVPIAGVPTDLGLCKPADAPSGQVPFTDGAPSNAMGTYVGASGNTGANAGYVTPSTPYLQQTFPYLAPPLRGSPRPQNQP